MYSTDQEDFIESSKEFIISPKPKDVEIAFSDEDSISQKMRYSLSNPNIRDSGVRREQDVKMMTELKEFMEIEQKVNPATFSNDSSLMAVGMAASPKELPSFQTDRHTKSRSKGNNSTTNAFNPIQCETVPHSPPA